MGALSRSAAALATCLGLIASAAWGQEAGSKVTLTLEGVQSDAGDVVGALCGEPKGQFPGGCLTYYAKSKAHAGDTVVTFEGVKPGRYAVQAFHDENSDGRTEIPPEGFAFGNDAAYPPSFEAAAVAVAGDTQVRARMTYVAGVSAGRPTGSKGAAAPEGVTRVDVRDKGLYGELYLPAHAGRLPALILIGGSEGGLDVISNMAASFAQKGYAALALAYWAEEGLPTTLEMVPLEYFDGAVAWLKSRPEIDPSAIGAIGWSRGSEAVLLLGSRNKEVKAVAAVAPSGIVWQGLNYADTAHGKPAWTVAGAPLPYVVPATGAYRPGAQTKDVFVAALAEADKKPEAAIPVEQINGPILLISGEDDHLWPSTDMANRIVARLKAKGFRHGVTHLRYPGAGHFVFIGAPGGPLAAQAAAPSPMLGGSPEANAKAWADDWPKTLAFFDKALKRGRR